MTEEIRYDADFTQIDSVPISASGEEGSSSSCPISLFPIPPDHGVYNGYPMQQTSKFDLPAVMGIHS